MHPQPAAGAVLPNGVDPKPNEVVVPVLPRDVPKDPKPEFKNE